MYRPATRVLAVLELLQAHGQISGTELARRLEVDPRTLRRYISMLEEMGVPITSEHGRHGGYRLVSGFKLPPMMFTEEEALAVSIGLAAARSLGPAQSAPAVASAQAKLERVLPPNLKRRVRDVDSTVKFDLASPVAAGDNVVFATLSRAAQCAQTVQVSYRNRSGVPSERRIDPYGLAYRSGGWYVIGFCHLRGAVRSFRFDRIRAAHLTRDGFRQPEAFDAIAHLTRSVALLPRRFAIEVRLQIELDTARHAVSPSLGVVERSNDEVLLRAQADDLAWFARELARLPFAFEILRPTPLRAALRAHAEALFEMASTGEDGAFNRAAARALAFDR